jgi:exosortase K
MNIHIDKNNFQKNTNLLSALLYHLPFLCIGLAIKYFYSIAENNELDFILFPTHLLVEIWTGHQGIFEAEKGYIFSTLGICIDKSCAGLNFWVITFLSGGFAWAMKSPRLKYLPFYLAFLLCISFMTTIFTNSSRIFMAIIALKSFPHLASFTWFHEVQGTFIFLHALFLFYLGIAYFIDSIFLKYSKRNMLNS